MKRYIITEAQLKEYVEKKRAEKTFSEIWDSLYKNTKFLKENVSLKKANQSIINSFNNDGKLTPKVCELLIKRKIINENNEII